MQRRGNRRLVDYVREAVALLDDAYLTVDISDGQVETDETGNTVRTCLPTCG